MARQNKIGIDGRFYADAGPGRYVKNILEYLEKIDQVNEYVVFLLVKGFEQYQPHSPNFKKVLVNSKWYSWKEQTVFLYQTLMHRLDIFYVPHFNVPILYPGKIVTAIPDIIMHSFSTEKGTTLPKPYFRFKKLIYMKVLDIVLKKSQKIIVPTYDVFNDIITFYPLVPKEKFVVAYEGVDPVFESETLDETTFLSRLGVSKNNYLLYISSMYEHKNADRLIDAFVILKNKYKYSGKLVLVGKKDKFSQKIYEKVCNLGMQEQILMPGMAEYIGDVQTLMLRKSASLYVFPSLKEGFSLTPLEAQFVGLPCVISDISCHREVFGNSVVYFDPFSVDDIVEKINKVLLDVPLQNELIARGKERVKLYDWLNTAKITLQVFNEVIAGKKRL